MFAPPETLVSAESSGREAEDGEVLGAEWRRRFTTATQYFRLKRRSQIFIMWKTL